MITNTPKPETLSAAEWQELLEKMTAEMACCTGTIHRLESQESGELVLVAQLGIPEPLMPKIQRIPIGKGIAGAAAERREPVQLCNLQTDTSGVAKPEAKTTQVSGSLAIPVIEDGQLVGTLGVGMREPHDFDEAEIGKLQAIGHWLSGALAKQT